MSKSLKLHLGNFKFAGQRFTKDLRDLVIELHNDALQEVLEFLVVQTPNFTGETQATFRQFRDYLSTVARNVEIVDVPNYDKIARYSAPTLRRWRTAEKIKNLPNAGNETLHGGKPNFECIIDRSKYSIKIRFNPSGAFDVEGTDVNYKEMLTEAKHIYKRFVAEGIEFIFNKDNIKGRLKSYIQRGEVRG